MDKKDIKVGNVYIHKDGHICKYIFKEFDKLNGDGSRCDRYYFTYKHWNWDGYNWQTRAFFKELKYSEALTVLYG